MKKIKKGGLRRRIAVGTAGARGGIGLLTSRASGLLLPKEKQQAHNEAALEREAMRFVKQLGELKGAYVKIGQMLALYGEHLLPRPVTNALHTLEAQTTAMEWTVMAEQLDEQYRDFEIEGEPMAAASLSQVHRAKHSGIDHPLCLKIQYPGVAETIEDDFKNVMQMLSLARWIKSGRQLEQLTVELKQHLMQEVDYRYEFDIAQKVSDLVKTDSRYLVPAYHGEYSSESVLTMEFIEGLEVTHPDVQALSQSRRNRLAEAMLELFFNEAFRWQLMQTDPNFGNYRILIDQHGEDDKLVLLDFGAVHHLPDEFSRSLKKTILAAHRRDMETTIEGATELRCLRPNDTKLVKQSFAKFCCFILEPFSSDLNSLPEFARTPDGLYDWQASRLLKRAGRLGSEGMLVKGFAIPPSEFMLIMRKLTGVFTFVSALGAKTSAGELLDQYAE